MTNLSRNQISLIFFTLLASVAPQLASASCAVPANAIEAENCNLGTDSSVWDITGLGDASIQGYPDSISVNIGSSVNFKIATNANAYTIDIYRMGWYQGNGARLIASNIPKSATLPQTQPPCVNDPSTGLNDCYNWGVSASWNVPANAVSGVYFAKLTRADTDGASHIFFIVRDDARHADIVFQTSDTTWQAYNQYGGNSLYVGSPAGRAYKVSYNRPITTRGTSPEDFVFNSEYPMIRWLEQNSYNVTYISGVDTDRFGANLLNHKVFMSVGHDEYWSGAQRSNVEAARNAGVSLVFLSGNEIFWKTRYEADGAGVPYRTLVCYKETHANAKIDPLPNVWTGTWRDNRAFNPQGSNPENALSGTLFMVNSGTTAISVPAADGKMRLWRNTSVANLSGNQVATLAPETLGYEWDEELDNGARPAGLFHTSTTVANGVEVLQDQGSNYGPGNATHHLTMYRRGNALVFGAGTVQWSWGLDNTHDRGGNPADARMQQATVNLLADMGVQPQTLQAGLSAATASTDTTAPSSVINSPVAGSTVSGSVVISGTATDGGGGVVGGVEVSTDNGTTWHPATGRESWTYNWSAGAGGTATLRVRAVDDSGNLGAPSAGTTVNQAAATCPCSIFSPASSGVQENDSNAVELGVRLGQM